MLGHVKSLSGVIGESMNLVGGLTFLSLDLGGNAWRGNLGEGTPRFVSIVMPVRGTHRFISLPSNLSYASSDRKTEPTH